MKFTVRNSHMYSSQLFKYVSVGQSATGHKHSKNKRNLRQRKRSQSFVHQTTCRQLQYMQDLKVESIWSIVLNLKSVAGSSSFWYNILVVFLLEEKSSKHFNLVASGRIENKKTNHPAATYFCWEIFLNQGGWGFVHLFIFMWLESFNSVQTPTLLNHEA